MPPIFVKRVSSYTPESLQSLIDSDNAIKGSSFIDLNSYQDFVYRYSNWHKNMGPKNAGYISRMCSNKASIFGSNRFLIEVIKDGDEANLMISSGKLFRTQTWRHKILRRFLEGDHDDWFIDAGEFPGYSSVYAGDLTDFHKYFVGCNANDTSLQNHHQIIGFNNECAENKFQWIEIQLDSLT